MRTKVIQNSAITTNSVSEQYADSIFAEYNDVVRSSKLTLIGYSQRVEATIPISLAIILSKSISYGEKKYGTFLYSGLIERQINRINYSLDNNNNFTIQLDLGSVRPSIAEAFAQIEYQLEQQRAGAL